MEMYLLLDQELVMMSLKELEKLFVLIISTNINCQ